MVGVQDTYESFQCKDVTMVVMKRQIWLARSSYPISPIDLPASLRMFSGTFPTHFNASHFNKCAKIINHITEGRNKFIVFKNVWSTSGVQMYGPNATCRFHVGVLSPVETECKDMADKFCPYVEWLSTCVSDGCKMQRFPLLLLNFQLLNEGRNVIEGGIWNWKDTKWNASRGAHDIRKYTGVDLEVTGRHKCFRNLKFFK